MAADSQRTEKPTKRKIEKSRREGQFPASRELLAALQFLTFVILLAAGGSAFFARTRDMVRYFLCPRLRAFAHASHRGADLHPAAGAHLHALFWMGASLMAAALAAQLASTRLGLSLENLAPDPKRLNPLAKASQRSAAERGRVGEAVVFLPLLALAVYKIADGNLAAYAGLAREGLEPALRLVGDSFRDFLWKAAALFCAIGILDFVRVYRHHYKSLRMTKLEVRDELKETEGNPQIKQRVRRIQRDLARRNMMKEIPQRHGRDREPHPFRRGYPLRDGGDGRAARAGQGQELSGAAHPPDRARSSSSDRRESAAGPGALPIRRRRPGDSPASVPRRGRSAGLHLQADAPGQEVIDDRRTA